MGGLDLTSNRYGIRIAGDEGRLKRIEEKEIVERMGGESRGWREVLKLLCRWDTPDHPITDVSGDIYPYEEYTNSIHGYNSTLFILFYDFIFLFLFLSSSNNFNNICCRDQIDRKIHPRMGWHDVQLSVGKAIK